MVPSFFIKKVDVQASTGLLHTISYEMPPNQSQPMSMQERKSSKVKNNKGHVMPYSDILKWLGTSLKGNHISKIKTVSFIGALDTIIANLSLYCHTRISREIDVIWINNFISSWCYWRSCCLKSYFLPPHAHFPIRCENTCYHKNQLATIKLGTSDALKKIKNTKTKNKKTVISKKVSFMFASSTLIEKNANLIFSSIGSYELSKYIGKERHYRSPNTRRKVHYSTFTSGSISLVDY